MSGGDIMFSAGFMGYCRFCGKPCYRGDEKVVLGRGQTKSIIYFHKRCHDNEQKEIRKQRELLKEDKE